MNLLVVYGSTTGQTRKIADRLVYRAGAQGISARSLDSSDRAPRELPYTPDAVLVGGSVHHGHHQTGVSEFIRANRGLLEELPSGLFSVSLTAALHDDLHERETGHYVDTLAEETGWQPVRVARIAGALRPSEYDELKKVAVKLLYGNLGPEISTSEDREYTDWQAVDRFVDDFLAALLANTGSHPAGPGEGSGARKESPAR